MFDRAGGFIRCYDATKLFGPEQYDGIYDQTSYTSKRSYYIFFSHNYAKIKIDSDDDLSLEKNIDSACCNTHEVGS